MKPFLILLVLLFCRVLEVNAQWGIGAGFTSSGYKYKVDLGNIALVVKSSPLTRIGLILRNNMLATTKDVLIVQPQINGTYRLLRRSRFTFYTGLGFGTSVDFKRKFDRVHYIQLRVPVGAELFLFKARRMSISAEGAPAYFFARNDEAFGLASAFEVCYYFGKRKLRKLG